MVLVGTAFQSIGLGFGSAAGVSVARPERTTVLVSGDGGGLMGLADFETFLRATRRGVVVVLNDSAYGAELHQYTAKGLHDQAMLIDEVDFAAVGRALGAYGTKAVRRPTWTGCASGSPPMMKVCSFWTWRSPRRSWPNSWPSPWPPRAKRTS
jgi:thiamine pyrophosphate-dependent acetolactate synthase large subunit-like protein